MIRSDETAVRLPDRERRTEGLRRGVQRDLHRHIARHREGVPRAVVGPAAIRRDAVLTVPCVDGRRARQVDGPFASSRYGAKVTDTDGIGRAGGERQGRAGDDRSDCIPQFRVHFHSVYSHSGLAN